MKMKNLLQQHLDSDNPYDPQECDWLNISSTEQATLNPTNFIPHIDILQLKEYNDLS